MAIVGIPGIIKYLRTNPVQLTLYIRRHLDLDDTLQDDDHNRFFKPLRARGILDY